MDEFVGPNAGYVAELLERYARDPAAVASADRDVLARLALPAESRAAIAAPEGGTSAAAAAAALAQGIRLFGYRAARLDPLGLVEPPGDPQLDLGAHGVTQTDLERLPASVVGGPVAETLGLANARQAIVRLEQVYSGTTGYELAHVGDPAERLWLLRAIEEERFRPPADPIDERELLDRLTEVSAFERFLHRAYPGQTRFSVEGLGMLIPMLDELIAVAALHGTRTVVLGMAHRGRLNVLAHVLGKPYARILAEFEGRVASRRGAPTESSDEGWTGDVKYHAGGRRAYQPDAAEVPGSVTVMMAPNPSHLEFVNPVVQGMARAARQQASLAVLIHGDASFPGQGVVAESLNLSRLPGYQTGGSVHIIANNQLGFTTPPEEGRSTLFASDLAKGFEMPIVHVNADDPIASLAAVRLAVAYRATFAKDVLIDLVGYRRWGHNEGDDPSLTQPRMYAAIERHPTVRELFAADLVQRGVIRESEPEAFLKGELDEFQRIRQSVLQSEEAVPATERVDGRVDRRVQAPGPGNVSWDDLRRLNDALLQPPDSFSLSRKLARPLARRREAFSRPDAPIDWGHAETLALATLLQSGTPVRLTGQDTVRGTFSQRHLAFYDTRTGEAFVPLAALPDRRADLEVHNSPLSEAAPLGFEYGYTLLAPGTLVLWEAQYGDFINSAQVIVDEFVAAGEAKWGLASGLVLLLPHAWEGQGPDHSSGRLERFLELAAEDNIRVASCTTAAQYYHLLRHQAASLPEAPRPLVVMTPKSLLRHPLATSRAADLVERQFQPVLDDIHGAAERPDRVERIVLCSGHVWVDLESARGSDDGAAVLRLEELYPFPAEPLGKLLDKYRSVREVVWLQEEPRNMGGWPFVEPRLRDVLGERRQARYVGRPERASPAEGWQEAHAAEQRRIIGEALGGLTVHAR
jgi:2-oxoglutarate dehydrogenase E1 component